MDQNWYKLQNMFGQ